MKKNIEVLEIFKTVRKINIDDAPCYFKNRNNKNKQVIIIRGEKGYCEIYINYEENKMLVKCYLRKEDCKFVDYNKYMEVLPAMKIKEIEKQINNPIWYDGLYISCK